MYQAIKQANKISQQTKKQASNKQAKNEKQAKQEFETRVKETKRRAIEENVKLAEESGNKLTQNITEDGDLVGVKGSTTTERNLENTQVSSADIRKELFEGDNILTSKKK